MSAVAPKKPRRNLHRDDRKNRAYLRKGRCYICLQSQYRWVGGEGVWLTGGEGELKNFSHCSTAKGAQLLESIPLPCCDKFFHECCIVEWMDHKWECPHCRAQLVPDIEGSLSPTPPGKKMVCLRVAFLSTKHANLVRGWAGRHNYWEEDGFDISTPVLTPPRGWVEFRRREHPPILNRPPQGNFRPG